MFSFAKMCRLCLNNKSFLINFNDCDLDNISAYDKLNKIIPELVTGLNNKFPPWICPVCNEELNNSYIFLKKCEKSIDLLQSYSEQLRSVNTDSLPQDLYSLKTEIFKINTTIESSFKAENNVESIPIKDETSNVIQEELNLLPKDTFLFDENSTDSNISIVKNEIPGFKEEYLNFNYFYKTEDEKNDFNILHKSALEQQPIVETERESIKTEIDGNKISNDIFEQKNLIHSIIENYPIIPSNFDKTIEELNNLIDKQDENVNLNLYSKHRSRRCKRSVCYNEESGEESNCNRDLELEKNSNMNCNKVLSDNSVLGINKSSNPVSSVNNIAEQLKISSSQNKTNGSNLILTSKKTNLNCNESQQVENTKTPSTISKINSLNPQYISQTVSNNSNINCTLNYANTDNSINKSFETSTNQSVLKLLLDSKKNCKVNNIFPYFPSRINDIYQNGLNSTDTSESDCIIDLTNSENVCNNNQTTPNLSNDNVQNLASKSPTIVIHYLPNTNSSNAQSNDSIPSKNMLHLGAEKSNYLNLTQNINKNNEECNVVTKNDKQINETSVNKPTEKVKLFRRKFVCNICRNKFKSSEELKQHVASHEVNIRKCKCKMCIKNNDLEHKQISPILKLGNSQEMGLKLLPLSSAFEKNHSNPDTSTNIESSQENSTESSTFEVKECKNSELHDSSDYSFDDDGDFYMEKYFCTICNKKYKNFSEHMESHQKDKAICVYCDETFPIKNQLFQHLRDVHCSKDPLCQICNETYQNIDLLFLHMYSHYGTHVHKCPKCEMLFLQADLMYLHLESNHNIEKFECYKCDKSFDSYKLISHHILQHDSRSSTLCYVCGQSFHSSRRLNIHMSNMHAHSLEYICHVCGKQFNTKRKLRNHINWKHDDKIFKCNICPKFFFNKKSISLHMNRHSEEKKRFVCLICGKKFQLKFLLINHERIHSGETPFECKICGKKFKQEVTLVVHTRIHTGQKPYSCSECGKSYTQSYVYKMHLKKHHNNEENKNSKKNDKL